MKEQRPYNGAKIVSLTNGTETTANLQAKKTQKKSRHRLYTFYKIKMNHRPKYKTQNYKTPRCQHRIKPK